MPLLISHRDCDTANRRSQVAVRNGRKQDRCGLIALLVCLFIGLIAGCQDMPATSIYENQKQHLSLRKPRHWRAAYYERSGQIILEAKTGMALTASARVEIWGNHGVPSTSSDGMEQVQLNIDRIRMLYDLDSVTIVQPPTKTLVQGREVVTAIIGLPMAELPNESAINPVGGHSPGVMQMVDMRWISDSDHCGVMVYLYKGYNEVLNAEAEHIVDTLQYSCPVVEAVL